jgi:hypothetical protein
VDVPLPSKPQEIVQLEQLAAELPSAASAKQKKSSHTKKVDKITYREPLPNHHRPSGTELYKMLRLVRTEQQTLRQEQQRILKAVTAIQCIMEMWIKGDVGLTPKVLGDNIGIG